MGRLIPGGDVRGDCKGKSSHNRNERDWRAILFILSTLLFQDNPHVIPESSAPRRRAEMLVVALLRGRPSPRIYASTHKPHPHSIPNPHKGSGHGSDSTSGGNVPNKAIKCSTLAGVRGLPASAALASIRKSKLAISTPRGSYSNDVSTHNRHIAL